MKKKSDRKLTLSRETLTKIQEAQLRQPAGGATEYPCLDTAILTNYVTCICATFNGCSFGY